MVPSNKQASEPEADPALWNGTWVSWRDEIDMDILVNMRDTEQNQMFISIMGIVVILLCVVAFLTLIIRVTTTSVKLSSIPSDGINVISIFKTTKEESNPKKEIIEK